VKTYQPKEALARLDALCPELKNYNVDLGDIEMLRQLGLRFEVHFAKLESFQQRLGRWAEGFKC
jgi:hypothetical protein